MTPERAAQIIRMTPRIFSVDQDKLSNNDRFIAQEVLRDEMMKDAGQLPLNTSMMVEPKALYSDPLQPEIADRHEKVRVLHAGGMTSHNMADTLGCSRAVISHDLRHMGLKPNIKRKPNPLVTERRKKVEALMGGTMSCRDIANHLGATYNMIKHDFGVIQARRRAEAVTKIMEGNGNA